MPYVKRVLATLLLLAPVLHAQDVGMGPRRGSGERFEAPYTLEIETPHAKWAKPLRGGPIRVSGGAQRSPRDGRWSSWRNASRSISPPSASIRISTSINGPWRWAATTARAPSAGDFSLLYGYLEQELTSDKPFDVILLQTSHGWEALTERSREAIARRVREGCGLVWVRPFASELSPLEPEEPVAQPGQPYSELEPGKTEASPWRRVADHYITQPIPVETFPFDYLENYLYRAAPDATVLVASASGHPVVATREIGKGRVVGLGYRNFGLSWDMPMTVRHFVSSQSWEAFYAMLCRALIYAARRESRCACRLAGALAPAAAERSHRVCRPAPR